jgi:3-oxoacid CoA-transferase subunit A
MANKVYPDAASALEGLLFDGMLIASGGFGLCGLPERRLNAIQESGVKDLVFASNNAASTIRASASCCARSRCVR